MNILINNFGSQVNDITELLHEDPNCKVIYLVKGVETGPDNFKGTVDIVDLDMDVNTDITEYVKFITEKCIQYKIDAFIPFAKMDELVDFKDYFESQGVALVVPSNNKTFKMLNNKFETYNFLSSKMPEIIPSCFCANTKKQLLDAVNVIHDSGSKVCIKYCEDISAYSVRIVSFERRSLDELDFKTSSQSSYLRKMLTYRDLVEMLEDMDDNDLLPRQAIVMEYLDGKEVSCDCLRTEYGNIILPRVKITGKIQHILKDEELIKLCDKILEYTGYDSVCNIQFKYSDGRPMLLEVNTRMSGGVQIASKAVSINIPLLAIKDKLGRLTEDDVNLNWESTVAQCMNNYKFRKL